MPIRSVCFALSLLIPALAAAAGGDELAKPCFACHSATGVAAAPNVPHLNGQLADYLQQEISMLGTGERKSDVADHVPKAWNAKDILAVAKYYATSKAERPKQATDAAKIALGEPLYKKRCAECHADNGRQSDKDAPLMAGQDLTYLAEQTKLFVSNKRRFPFMMDEAYKGLTTDQLEAISHFFASQEQLRKRK
jgi:sulfide dehydrogenase cytochrome subunit